MSKRIFTQNEVARLIRRAAELEAERNVSHEHSQSGLSLDELQHIASESGIDPEMIQKAAEEFENSSESSSTKSESTPKKGTTKVKNSEIFCERWIDTIPDAQVMDDLIVELNHRYDTSDTDISWWDKLWDDYSGKAKVRKTKNSVEWQYTDEWEMQTVRALLQIRGNRFRIRISKKEMWGMSWNVGGAYNWLLAPVLIGVGALLGHFLQDSILLGAAAGSVLFAVVYPISKMFNIRHINSQKEEVTDMADDLAELTAQLMSEKDAVRENKSQKSSSHNPSSSTPFNSQFDEESGKGSSGRIKNILR